MKETKIYIVESSEGEYSDSPSWIEKAFRRKEDAEAFARQLDAERFAEPAIEVKLWEEAENVWYCTNEEKYGMNWDAVPDDISHDKEKMRGIHQGTGRSGAGFRAGVFECPRLAPVHDG